MALLDWEYKGEDQEVMDWTHEGIRITDIRKAKSLYAITIDAKDIEGPLLIDSNIFEERIKSYFLYDLNKKITRNDILSIKWNMHISKGYFIKYTVGPEGIKSGKKMKDPNKYYVSFLEIHGPLGTFDTVIPKKTII